MSLLSLISIGKRYGAVSVLEGISLTVSAGGRTAIVGPSGSGKSSLLRLIAGFERPDVGSISLDGNLLADRTTSLPAHARGIGIVTQDGALFPHLSIAENIGFGLDRATQDRDRRIAELIDMVELDRSLLSRRPHQLSGGQQQRIALARALGRQPRLMLLDEPFSALDTGLRDAMRRTVARVLQTAGIATVLVTHDQAEALSFADQVAVLRAGRLMQCGAPRTLYYAPTDKETALFLGEALFLPAMIDDGIAVTPLGPVPVRPGSDGAQDIMLRPEQIRLSVAGTGVRGQILEVEFGGATCRVTVALENNSLPPLSFRACSADLPEPGSHITVSIVGTAHRFTAA